MAYHTLAQLQSRVTESTLIQLTDDLDVGTVDTDHTDMAAGFAEATIDLYLRSRYTLPLDSVPDSMVEISCSLATYKLYFRRHGQDVPAAVQKQYDTAMAQLKEIRDGAIKLFDSDKGIAFSCNKTAEDRVFTKTVLDQF